MRCLDRMEWSVWAAARPEELELHDHIPAEVSELTVSRPFGPSSGRAGEISGFPPTPCPHLGPPSLHRPCSLCGCTCLCSLPFPVLSGSSLSEVLFLLGDEAIIKVLWGSGNFRTSADMGTICFFGRGYTWNF